jgi:D-inositol-3-phosphate glycosyltransferase
VVLPFGPMRLLLVTARYPTTDRPGAGVFVRSRLTGAAIEAVVIAPDRYDRPGWKRYALLGWRALAARGRFDGVECHFLLPTGPIALLAARLRRLPLVVYAHGGDVRDMANRNRLFRFLARLVVRRAAAVVTNSNATADLVRHLEREAIVIHPGIELARFAASPRPKQRRVLYLGGDVPHKGVEVARQLADTLVGPGIRELDPDEIPALIAEHDVVLVPSLAEPYGLVACEAIASGRWVVASDVDGLREVVRHGINGTLVSDGDFEAALAAVPDYDPREVARSAEAFSADRYREGLDQLWRSLLSDGRS